MREDAAVGVVVEIFRPDDEGHFVGHFRQEKQAAEHGPLGFEAARRLAVEKLAEAVVRSGALFIFDRGHGSRSVVRRGESIARPILGRCLRRTRIQCVTPRPGWPGYFPSASVATAGTTHTLSSPSTSLE